MFHSPHRLRNLGEWRYRHSLFAITRAIAARADGDFIAAG
jgi:hypothetical protein